MLEVKLQKTEEDLKKQNLQVESLRAVLQRKSADESNLREENKNLSEKVDHFNFYLFDNLAVQVFCLYQPSFLCFFP